MARTRSVPRPIARMDFSCHDLPTSRLPFPRFPASPERALSSDFNYSVPHYPALTESAMRSDRHSVYRCSAIGDRSCVPRMSSSRYRDHRSVNSSIPRNDVDRDLNRRDVARIRVISLADRSSGVVLEGGPERGSEMTKPAAI